MHATPLARPILIAVSLWLLACAGCGPAPSPVSVRAKQQLNGPPDLAKNTAADPRWHAFQLRTFQMNHVWAGVGHAAANGQIYRAKLTLWDYDDENAPVAEIYFHDTGSDVPNPDFKSATRPYQLHFPIGSIGPILQGLRNANEPIYLYYYDDQWAVGIGAPEPVGID